MRSQPENPRRSWPRRNGLLGAACGLAGSLLALSAFTGSVWGAFTGQSTNAGNVVTGRPDWRAPLVGNSVVQKVAGGAAGHLRPGGSYRVYANVTDAGNPASGVATVTGNLAALTPGQGAAALLAGAYTVDGRTYNFGGPVLIASASLAAGTYAYSLAATDRAGNSAGLTGLPVSVDATAPTAGDIQTTNKAGGTPGRPELGDTVIFTFSAPIDPNSVLSGWTGAATGVVLRIDNNSPNNDLLSVYNLTNTTRLSLGTVDLGLHPGFVSSGAVFGVGGTASTMVETGNTIAVTLGTESGGVKTAKYPGTMTWSPSAAATDRAGNAVATTPRTESGPLDMDF